MMLDYQEQPPMAGSRKLANIYEHIGPESDPLGFYFGPERYPMDFHFGPKSDPMCF